MSASLHFRVRDDGAEDARVSLARTKGQISVFPGFSDKRTNQAELSKIEAAREDPLVARAIDGDPSMRLYVAISHIRHVPLSGFEAHDYQTPEKRPLGVLVGRMRGYTLQLLRSIVDQSLSSAHITGKMICKVQREQRKRGWDAIGALVSLDDDYTHKFLVDRHGFRIHADVVADGGQAYRLDWRDEARRTSSSY